MGDYERLYGKQNEPEKESFFSAKKVIIAIILGVAFLALGMVFIEDATKQTNQNQTRNYQPPAPNGQLTIDIQPNIGSIANSNLGMPIPNEQSTLANNPIECLYCFGTGKIRPPEIFGIPIMEPTICPICGGSGYIDVRQGELELQSKIINNTLRQRLLRDSIRLTHLKQYRQPKDTVILKEGPQKSNILEQAGSNWQPRLLKELRDSIRLKQYLAVIIHS